MSAASVRAAGGAWSARSARGYLLSFVGIGLTTLLIAGLRSITPLPNLSILYLFPILALASRHGRGPALLAALLAFLSANFFFVVPVHTLAVSDPAEWVALLTFLAVALVAGQLAAALRASVEESQRRERITANLYELSRALVAKQEPGALLAAVATQIVAVFGVPGCAIYLPDDTGRLRQQVFSGVAPPAAGTPHGDEETLVNWAFAAGGERGPERHQAALFVPLQTGGRCLGVLRIDAWDSATWRGMDHERLVETFAAQAALALEQARLAGEAARADVLARADAAKDALLAAVSHDLRTPLAVIRAAAGSLLQEDIEWDTETRREFASAIDDEAQRLNRLVGALLEMSRIDAGALYARKVLYPLDALIRTTVARYLAGSPEAVIRLYLPDDLPPVPLDPVQIERVLGNLLDNALKYAPVGTPIVLAATCDADSIVVSVTDRGPGIPAAERERVFGKFYRLQGAHEAIGSGLGLSIARGLIAAHGGRIWVEDGPDGGARFAFTLPRGDEPRLPDMTEDDCPANGALGTGRTA